MKSAKLEKKEEEERELIRTMFKLGTGDVTSMFQQSHMCDEKITSDGCKPKSLFSLLNLSERVALFKMNEGNIFATFKEDDDRTTTTTSISLILDQQENLTLLKIIWQQEGFEFLPTIVVANKNLPVRAITNDGIQIVKSWLSKSINFSQFSDEVIFGIDHYPIAVSSITQKIFDPNSAQPMINLTSLADNDKKAQSEIDVRAIYYIWGEDILRLLNADFKLNANGLVSGFKITKQMIERLFADKEKFSADSIAKLDTLSLEEKINLLTGRWSFGSEVQSFQLSFFYGMNGTIASKDDLGTFLRNLSMFMERASGNSNLIKSGIDKLIAITRRDEFLSASISFFHQLLKQIVKSLSLNTNDPAFQVRTIMEQNLVVNDIFDGKFLDGKSFVENFHKYNTEALGKLIEASANSEELKRKPDESKLEESTNKKKKIPKPQPKPDSTPGTDHRNSFPCFKRLCEIPHVVDECFFNHEKEIFSVSKSKLLLSANRLKEGSNPTKQQAIDKITESFLIKSSDSEENKTEKRTNGAK